MAIVQNGDELLSVRPTTPMHATLSGSIRLFDDRQIDHADLYKTQHEVRTVIDFLARNISQIPLQAYRRISDTERERITGTPLTDTIENPDVYTTRSRWMEALVKDLCIFDEAIRIKVRHEDGKIALVRIPPNVVKPIGDNWLHPEAYQITGRGKTLEYSRDEVIHIHGYDPKDPRKGLSTLETLRQLLAEQYAAAEHREGLWRQGARASLVIERPLGAPPWSDNARSRFKAEWDASFTGARNSGKTAVLEEGMVAKPLETFSPRDAQYLETAQLAREIVAAAYGVPAGLLGLGATTYASLTEQNRQLYQNALAPWLTLIQEELEAQLLPEYEDNDGIYLEFQLQDKLRGSFEEQAAVLQASVGAPYLTRNEARARLNLSSIEGGDELVTPLNVLIGGQASPQDSVSDERTIDTLSNTQSETKSALGRDGYVRIRSEAAKEMNTIFRRNIERQRRSVISKLGAQKNAIAETKANTGRIYDQDRFDRELAKDLLPTIKKTAKKSAATVGDWDVENGQNYLEAVAGSAAKRVNQATRARIATRLAEISDEDDPIAAIDGLFDEMTDNDNISAAYSVATSVANFARNESAIGNGRRMKTWIVTSGNPRSTHAVLDGESVPIEDDFSNGAPWPGHPSLDAEETANCQCICDFGD
jgi:HK97 family phage portal protein